MLQLIIYCWIFSVLTCLIAPSSGWKILFKEEKKNISVNFWIGIFFTFFAAFFVSTLLLVKPNRLSLFSNIVIAGVFSLISFMLLWCKFEKNLSKKKIFILVILLIACFALFKQDQNAFWQIDNINSTKIETAKNFEFPDIPVTITDMSQPTFTSNDIEFLTNITWDDAYQSNGKTILFFTLPEEVLHIAIVEKEISAYINVSYSKFIPQNIMPVELLFKNPINLGMTVDDKNVPYFKYALAKKNGILGSYSITEYALYNVLTGELSYFSELPDFAQ